MSLAGVQARFQARVVDGDGPSADVAERSQRGLRVYAHAYRATLTACLRDTFEKTHSWLGDDAFDTDALAYIAAQPSHSWTLSAYGDHFPAHLAGRYADDAEVEELAWLDLGLRRAFDGPDAGVLDPSVLTGADWEAARPRLHPTLRIRSIVTNSPSIWSAIAAGERPPSLESLAEPSALRVWRQDLVPTFRAVPAHEIAAVEMARAGDCFGRICEGMAATLGDDGAAAAAGAMLASWIEDGVLVALD